MSNLSLGIHHSKYIELLINNLVMLKKLFKSKKQDKPIPESKTFKLGMNFKQIDSESQI